MKAVRQKVKQAECNTPSFLLNACGFLRLSGHGVLEPSAWIHVGISGDLSCDTFQVIYIYIYRYTYIIYTYTYTYMHMHLHTRMHTYIHTRTHTHAHRHTDTQTHTDTYAYAYAYTYTCTCTCACVHAYIHAYIHTLGSRLKRLHRLVWPAADLPGRFGARVRWPLQPLCQQDVCRRAPELSMLPEHRTQQLDLER